MMETLIQGLPTENVIRTVTYDELRRLYEEYCGETQKNRRITAESHHGESIFGERAFSPVDFLRETQISDTRTEGMKLYLPHGVVIRQAGGGSYFRGENQIFRESVPSLLRALKKYPSREEQELYRLVADMRIAEFSAFLRQFEHVNTWDQSDVLYDALAQHYGLETPWLDITNDFNVAMFFATCHWKDGRWQPLTKEETERDEQHQYGVLFHMKSGSAAMRWLIEQNRFYPDFDKTDGKTGGEQPPLPRYDARAGEIQNLIYPLGFQPFMRCHMQNGYGIYMRTPHPLQQDPFFEKLRFRHSEELSRRVFERMDGGNLIYPHEGISQAEFVIRGIREATSFSEEAFAYALYRSHFYKMEEKERVRETLSRFRIDGKPVEIGKEHPWRISPARRRRINALYHGFSVEESYGIRILDRRMIPPPAAMFEPWMLPTEEDSRGVEDFRLRKEIPCENCLAGWASVALLTTVAQAELPAF